MIFLTIISSGKKYLKITVKKSVKIKEISQAVKTRRIIRVAAKMFFCLGGLFTIFHPAIADTANCRDIKLWKIFDFRAYSVYKYFNGIFVRIRVNTPKLVEKLTFSERAFWV